MNHSCEMWSRPWHALQKNLAEGISGHFLESSAFVGMVKERGYTVSTNSWLSRVQLRTPAVSAPQ
jgi:hypothetical protein